MRAPSAALEPHRLDETGPLELLECVVDDRTADGPDLPDLAAACKLAGNGPTVCLPLPDQRENGEIVRGQPLFHAAAQLIVSVETSKESS